MIDFRLLGPVEAVSDQKRLSIPSRKPRALLALLLLHRNRIMSAERLVGELWDERAPRTARNVLQQYVGELRQLLSSVGGSVELETHEPGYVLRLPAGALDVERFTRLTQEGRRALLQHNPVVASALLSEALLLWRGAALEDVPTTTALQRQAEQLEAARVTTLEARIAADMELGRHVDLVTELQDLVAQHPVRERLWEQLVVALYRSGRPSDALHAAREARGAILEEAGLEAGPSIKSLEGRILNRDPSLEFVEESAPSALPISPVASSSRSVVEIREAREDDYTFVVDLMTDALGPYYGGDHRAHAHRIFSTHIAGGKDQIGHFSLEQQMFIAEVAGIRAGMVHLVGKRQATYKISPLIVSPEFRLRHGVGAQLLAFAESHARAQGSRQIYCTVARENKTALQFFQRHGYIAAGRSDSHYKEGVTEVMLYKPLLPEEFELNFDLPHISVLPFEERYRKQVTSLLLKTLPNFFRGIDESWTEALFDGYERRHSGNVNLKFKLLFVAVDREEHILGVAGATPKKGEPIKVMPFIAQTLPAFTALLTDVPYLLKPYGRKLYIHTVPTVEETIALQERGWSLDAAIPAAYHEDTVTQQWSFDIESDSFMRMMRVKQSFLDLIRSGRKTLEVRVAYDSIKTIQPGERIKLMSRADSQIIRVKDVRKYTSFEEMLKVEPADRIAPGRTERDLRALLTEIYPAAKERLGVVVLEVAAEQ